MEFEYIKVPKAEDKQYTDQELANILTDYLGMYKGNKKIPQLLFAMVYEKYMRSGNAKNVFSLAKIPNNNNVSVFGIDLRRIINTYAVRPVVINKYIQNIYYGAPGTGKSHMAKEATKGMIVHRTTFHPDTDYSSFVGSYKPVQNAHGGIGYTFVPQVFAEAYCDAWVDFMQGNDKHHCLLIEEINRGNCAQIFGDIFQLLDRKNGFSEYSLIADKDFGDYIKNLLANIGLSKKDYYDIIRDKSDIADDGAHLLPAWNTVSPAKNKIRLCLPPNLSIVATMNTSDQSLFPMDSAFKRRWKWKYVPITEGCDANGKRLGWYVNVNGVLYDWWNCIQKINNSIKEDTSSEDKQLGYFFCSADGSGEISSELFVNKVLFYLYNDVFRTFGFDRAMFYGPDGKTIMYHTDYYNSDGSVNCDALEQFMLNLQVEDVTNLAPKPAAPSVNGYSYIVNGGQYSKHTNMVRKVFEIYLTNNPNLSDQDVVNNWKNVIDNVHVSHLIETSATYAARTDTKKQSTAEMANDYYNRGLYISNQYSKNTAKEFVEAVNNETSWGIKISII